MAVSWFLRILTTRFMIIPVDWGLFTCRRLNEMSPRGPTFAGLDRQNMLSNCLLRGSSSDTSAHFRHLRATFPPNKSPGKMGEDDRLRWRWQAAKTYSVRCEAALEAPSMAKAGLHLAIDFPRETLKSKGGHHVRLCDT